MDKNKFFKLFPLGSHLCREPMPPMSELKHDMELLKKNGFNMVKLQEHWMLDEPAEGKYDFSRYEELIEHAAHLDMAVYLGLTCEQAPHWLYKKYPDCRMVGNDGLPVAYEATTTLPSDGKPGPCYDHPEAMADHLRFITRLVKTLGRFENIVVWNTCQEIGYRAEGLVGKHVCFCKNTLAFFHKWLAEKFGDLDTLNRDWNTRYASWDDIMPARGIRPAPEAVIISWRYFMDNIQIANVLHTRADAIRAADPLKRPVFAHKGGPQYGSGQDWTFARCQDFLGCSCYPAWGCGHGWDDGCRRPFQREYAFLSETWDAVAYRYDYIRSANRGKGRAGGAPVWAAEFQGGPVSTAFHKGRVPSPEDIRRWMLAAVSSGVTGISFWVTRAEIMAAEQNGFSLLDSVGDTSSRFAEAGRIGGALERHAELFAAPTMAPAPVGILINEWNYQFCTQIPPAAEHLAYSIRGWWRMLWDLNIQADLVDIEWDVAHLKEYKILISPFPISLSETVAEKLAAYIEAGGNLISEAAPGRINEYSFCNRGELSPTMAKLFGVRQKAFIMVREPDAGSRWSLAERTWGEYLEPMTLDGVGPLAGHRLRANVYVQTFETCDSEPVLTAGNDVAGVRRRAGQGSAWLLGTYAGHSGAAYRDPAIHACVRAMLAECGVTPEHDGSLILRKRVIAGKQCWIFFNPTSQPLAEKVRAAGFRRAEDLFGGEIALKRESFELTVPALDFKAVILFR